MGVGKIKVTSEAVINDAVRLKKEEFKQLYVKEFGYHELDASRAWHQCRVSRRGKELLEKLVAPMLKEDEEAIKLIELAPVTTPTLSCDLKPGDQILVNQFATVVVKVVILASDGLEYVKYRAANGKIALKRPSAVTLIRRVGHG